MVMALFAFVWALLLPYYDAGTAPSELFPAYGGFILVYIGALLRREAAEEAHEEDVANIIQRLGLFLFLALASPGAIQLVSPSGGWALTRPQHEILLCTLINLVGYSAVAYGFWRLCGKQKGLPMAIFLVIYGLLEIWFTIVGWPSADAPPMPSYLKILFGIEKLCFTLLFCYWLSMETYTDAERQRSSGYSGPYRWIMKFMGLL
jgi:hypothetical protein